MAGALAAISVAWVGLLVAAPSRPAELAGVLYGAASLLCHQIPERSFYRGGVQLPVCARCLGIYMGLAAGSSAWWLGDARGRRASRIAIRTLLLVTALPAALTVGLEAIGAWHVANLPRAATGAILGVGLSCLLAWALTRATGRDAVRVVS